MMSLPAGTADHDTVHELAQEVIAEQSEGAVRRIGKQRKPQDIGEAAKSLKSMKAK